MSTFITFPVATTNIFPLSNSKGGGQLVTEYNLRSIDSVGTPSKVEYPIGPSYTHSERDYFVLPQSDDALSQVSSSVIQINPGRAVINGHFVETFAPMVVDLLAENNRLSKIKGEKPLRGKLAIGIRAIYSTEATMAGAMKVENTNNMYEGLQVVILPETEMKLPTDDVACKEDNKYIVNTHLKLATFTFYDGGITSVVNNPDKCRYIDADRISGMTAAFDNSYLKKTYLNPKKLYIFSGKGSDEITSMDTWCDAVDSLMVWDKKPGDLTTIKNWPDQAEFDVANDQAILTIPHKQVDGMLDANGVPVYYPPRVLALPVADYGTNSPGTVDMAYTMTIKKIAQRLARFHQLVKGKQVYYLENVTEDTKLPPINAAWEIGDYILVGQDFTIQEATDGIRNPSTMYAVLPGLVETIKYVGKSADIVNGPSSLHLYGAQLVQTTAYSDRDIEPDDSGLVSGELPTFFTEPDGVIGSMDTDYFVLSFYSGDDLKTVMHYFYTPASSKARSWSSAVLVTGQIPLASELMVGGFYNVPENNSAVSDAGYVRLDENGHLRLVDYGLLRTGALAYQLGEDIELSKGLVISELQDELDNLVNDRVAFPSSYHRASAANPNIINIHLDISKSDEAGELFIRNIDSRFGACVYLHLSGDATDNITINISDCERIRVECSLPHGGPKINIYRSSVYYEASVLNYIRTSHLTDSFTGMQDIRLWYEKFDVSDANLIVDGMTVSEMNCPVVSTDIDFWNKPSPNDNHYYYALKSITFAGDGNIVECKLLIANDSTNNIDTGNKLILSKFKLPQGYGLIYPDTCLTRKLKVTGTFVSSYLATSPEQGWVVTDTNFTAVTGVYDAFNADAIAGTIAFQANTSIVNADLGVDTIPGWETTTYHIFAGGVIS